MKIIYNTGDSDKIINMPDPSEREEKPGKPMSRKKQWLITILATLIVAVGYYYSELPAINLKSTDFWSYLLIISVVFSAMYYATRGILTPRQLQTRDFRGIKDKTASKIPIIVTAALILLPIVISFLGSATLLHARAYSRILTVNDGTVENIPSVEGTNTIALMDTASAEKLGNREIGSLSEVVSQYNVSSYTQIDFQGTPVKTSPLRYDGFFKWYRNRKNGVPGYVLVDPVDMSANYTPLEQGMFYVPSAYFNENLSRRIRFRYPTKMFDSPHFEIDEDGRPWYVASTYDHLVGLFGGEQVNGAIIIDPVTGDMEWYATGQIPQWVDVVFPGNLICKQYNDYAQLHNGYWNSIIGQAGCRRVTEYPGENDEYHSDFGFISKDGDIWIYTGVTSLNNDSSNIGFILSNERTEETIFITCSGADEFSAMASAQGEVQEKRYTASFPSLILVNGNPTYIMVLKDASGLVKMYATVNVEQYNMVATATTQDKCVEKYTALMEGRISQTEANSETAAAAESAEEEEPAVDPSAFEEKTVTIKKLRTIDRSGNTYLYLVDEDDSIYYAKYTDVIEMLLAEEGDTITIYTDGERFLLEK